MRSRNEARSAGNSNASPPKLVHVNVPPEQRVCLKRYHPGEGDGSPIGADVAQDVCHALTSCRIKGLASPRPSEGQSHCSGKRLRWAQATLDEGVRQWLL